MQAASQYPSFPMILETYRECLRDVFDIDGLNQLLEDIRSRRIRVHPVNSDSASPFAQTVLFDFTASFIYDADAPLAERRAQVLSLDHAQLRNCWAAPTIGTPRSGSHSRHHAQASAAGASVCERSG